MKSILRNTLTFLFNAAVMFTFAFLLAFGLVRELSADERPQLVQFYVEGQWDVSVYDDHEVIVLGDGILVGYDASGVSTVAFQVHGDTLTINGTEIEAYPYGDGLLAAKEPIMAFLKFGDKHLSVNGKYFDVSTYFDSLKHIRSL